MAAAEGAGPILQRGVIPPGRHPIVDRLGGAERDVGHGPRVRDVTPHPPLGRGRRTGENNVVQAVEFRITMVALAEEERVAGAVGDVLHANATVNEEDAVPGHARKIRRTTRKNRPFAGVAAITAHPIETKGPGWGAPL